MLPRNITFYSNRYYIGGGVNIFDRMAQAINCYENEVNFSKYSNIKEYLKDYDRSGYPSDVIELSDTLYKVVVYPPNRKEEYYYVSILSEEDILKQIKKDRLEFL